MQLKQNDCSPDIVTGIVYYLVHPTPVSIYHLTPLRQDGQIDLLIHFLLTLRECAKSSGTAYHHQKVLRGKKKKERMSLQWTKKYNSVGKRTQQEYKIYSACSREVQHNLQPAVRVLS